MIGQNGGGGGSRTRVSVIYGNLHVYLTQCLLLLLV